MKSAIFAVTALASLAIAQPHGHHRHQHNKRDMVVDWVYVTETVTVEIEDSTTLTILPTPTSSVVEPGQFFQGGTTTITSTTSVPTTITTHHDAPAPPAAATTTTPPAPAVVTPTTPAAAVPTTTQATGGSGSTGGGSIPNPPTDVSGTMTYFTIGLGMCGWDQTGMDMSVHIVAPSYLWVDSVSTLTNSGLNQPENPLCGKNVTIQGNGRTATAMIADRCPGCHGKFDLDASESLFLALFDSTTQGTGAITWSLDA